MRRAFAAPVPVDGSTMVHGIIVARIETLRGDIGGSTGFS
jgi:hypothetical protein